MVVTPDDPTFVVSGINVERTAADALQARNAAIAEGQRRALRMVIQRLAPQADAQALSQVDDRRLQSLVRGVETGGERTGADRYAATLTVSFIPDRVRAFLTESGVVLGDAAGLTVVIVPLWRTPQGVSPFDERTPWREAWERAATQSSVPGLRLIVMRGDDTDRRLVQPEQIFVYDVAALSRLAERYRANVVAVALLTGDPSAGPLTAEGQRYDRTTGARDPMARADGLSMGSLEEAARRQLKALEDEWKAISVVKRDTQDTLDAQVPIRDLGDWVRVRQKLQGLPAIKKLTVRALEVERANVQIEFFGSADDLQRALAAVGLQLQRDGNRWVLVSTTR